MKASNIIVGLDIGTTKIAAVPKNTQPLPVIQN